MVGAVRSTQLSAALLALVACAAPGGDAAPRTFVVRRDLGGIPTAHQPTARALVEAADALEVGDKERAGARLLGAATGSLQPRLAAHLRAAHHTWVSRSGQAELEASLLAGTAGPLVAPFHAESGQAPGAIQVGVVLSAEQERLDHLLGHLHRFEDWLELSAAGERPPRDRLVVARLLARAGDVEPGAVHTHLRGEAGSLSVFWSAMLRERVWRDGVRPCAELCLVPADAARVTADAHLRWYAARSGAEQLGPGVDRSRFGEDRAPLRLAWADAIGALARAWLVEELVADEEERAEAACTYVAAALRTLADARSGDEPPAHGAASTLELRRLWRAGALRLEQGRLAVDVDATLASARALCTELAAIAVQRDVDRARVLLHGEGLPRELEALVTDVLELPGVERVPVFR